MTVVHKLLPMLAFVLVGCGSSEAHIDVGDIESKMTEIEASLAGDLATNTHLCKSYMSLCDRGLSVCVEPAVSKTFVSLCASLQTRCDITIATSCTPTIDAGIGSRYTPPALVNPVNPLDFGAKCDGVTDDSAAFQRAIDAGDVLVPARTCLLNKTITVSTSHKHIECSPGAVLSHTDPFAGFMFRIVAFEAPLNDISIVNCHFLGTNTVAPQYFEADARHWDIPVMAQNTVDNLYVAGNIFERFFGQSMVQNYAPTYSGRGARIEYNTFKSCGYYGAALVASVDGYVGHNTLVDCALGIENDNASQATGGNVVEYNTLTALHGYGAPDMNASVMLTGGGAGGADYSKNIVRYNTVSGTGSAVRGSLPSQIYQHNAPGEAQYIGNVCGSGCVVIE